MKPPSTIDGAVVLEWAWSDLPFGQVPSEEMAVAVAIHGLAVCQYPDSSTIYRFSCNANWETEQDTEYPSVADAKALLPTQYRHAPVCWQKA